MKQGTLSFPFKYYDRVHEAENKLRNLKVSFDTGAGFGFRDWELDYTKGMTPDEIINWLKENHPDLYNLSKWSPREE